MLSPFDVSCTDIFVTPDYNVVRKEWKTTDDENGQNKNTVIN